MNISCVKLSRGTKQNEYEGKSAEKKSRMKQERVREEDERWREKGKHTIMKNMEKQNTKEIDA